MNLFNWVPLPIQYTLEINCQYVWDTLRPSVLISHHQYPKPLVRSRSWTDSEVKKNSLYVNSFITWIGRIKRSVSALMTTSLLFVLFVIIVCHNRESASASSWMVLIPRLLLLYDLSASYWTSFCFSTEIRANLFFIFNVMRGVMLTNLSAFVDFEKKLVMSSVEGSWEYRSKKNWIRFLILQSNIPNNTGRVTAKLIS